jgi:hypothetical protein
LAWFMSMLMFITVYTYFYISYSFIYLNIFLSEWGTYFYKVKLLDSSLIYLFLFEFWGIDNLTYLFLVYLLLYRSIDSSLYLSLSSTSTSDWVYYMQDNIFSCYYCFIFYYINILYFLVFVPMPYKFYSISLNFSFTVLLNSSY